MSDLVVNVRQVSSYPATTPVPPNAALLLQNGGLGSPYISATAAQLVATALQSGPALGVGYSVPANANPAQIFTGNHVLLPQWGIGFNTYAAGTGNLNWQNGYYGAFDMDGPNGAFRWTLGAGSAGAPSVLSPQMYLSQAGALTLPNGTLTVARDPGAALEVATMQWVGNSTVASFNGRIGAVQLTSSDVYQALCLDGAIATQTWVCEQLNTAFQAMLEGTVVRWNGRAGNVFLTLADITCVFFGGGQQPISPTPPPTSNDDSIATTAWVQQYVTESIAGGQGLATQAWVKANTVASFNTRIGAVTLLLSDITAAGGAPAASPNFTGMPLAPTANPGQATAQIATTAFVQQAVIASTTGVASWNDRTGAVVLEAQDIYDAGGALQASPAFTGTPSAPTAALGTATTQLATTAFVMNEVAATTAGVSSFNTRTGAVTLSLADITGAGGAPLASPAFSGTPTTPTPINPITGSLDIANTNWVVQYVSLNSVSSFNGRTGAIVLTANDLTAAGGLANPSPAMTGSPTAPTAVPGTATTQLATTQFVATAIAQLSGIIVSSTAPASPLQGTGWLDTTQMQLFVWTGMQWVIAVNPPTPNTANFAQLTGATFTGPVVLPAGSTVAGYVPLAGNANITPGPIGVGFPLPTGISNQTLTAGLALSSVNVSINAYSGATGWQRMNGTNAAGIISTTAGTLYLGAAPAGAANSAIAGWTTGLAMDPSGNVNVTSALTAGSISAAGATITNATVSNQLILPGGSNFSPPNSGGWSLLASNPNWSFICQPAADPNYILWANGAAIFQLFFAGNLTISGTLTQGSDETTKENIAPITQGISLIRQLLPKSFQRIIPPGAPNNTPPSPVQWGFMAQDVQPVIPAAVTEGSNNLLGLDITAIVAALSYCCQQLDKRCAALEAAASITPLAAELA